MAILGWIIMGALVGWIASMIAGTNSEQGAIGNIVVGILGAFVGGFLVNLLGGSADSLLAFSLEGFVVAVAGAVLLTWAYKKLA